MFGGKHKVCFQVLFVFFFAQELSRFLCLRQTLNSLLVIMESKVKVKSADDSDAPSETFVLESREYYDQISVKTSALGDLSTA